MLTITYNVDMKYLCFLCVAGISIVDKNMQSILGEVVKLVWGLQT